MAQATLERPAAPTDPTLTFLESLDDPARYRLVAAVPIMMPHVRTVRDGQGKVVKRIKVTPDDLPGIVRAMKRREDRYGVVGVLTEGHRQQAPDFPEKYQPDVLGYARNPRVGTFGPKQLPCVMWDEYIAVESWDTAKKYPHRSPEFYDAGMPEAEIAPGTITGAALLVRDPFLPLGMVAYSPGRACVMYSLESTVDDDKDKVPAPPADPGKPDDSILEDLGAPPEPAPEGHEDFSKHLDYACKNHPVMKYAAAQYEASQPKEGEEAQPVPMQAGFSTPNASNVAIPTLANGKPKTEAQRMALDQQAIQYAAVAREMADLKAQLAAERKYRLDAETKADRAECESAVKQLLFLGYQLDLAEETEELAGRPKGKRQAYLAKLQKNTIRNVVAAGNNGPLTYGTVPVYGGSVEGPLPSGPSKEETFAAVRYGAANKIEGGFDAMLAAYRNANQGS